VRQVTLEKKAPRSLDGEKPDTKYGDAGQKVKVAAENRFYRKKQRSVVSGRRITEGVSAIHGLKRRGVENSFKDRQENSWGSSGVKLRQ